MSDPVPNVVVVGNPFDGFTFYGPFNTPQDAVDWAIEESETAHGVIGNESWTAGVLNTP